MTTPQKIVQVKILHTIPKLTRSLFPYSNYLLKKIFCLIFVLEDDRLNFFPMKISGLTVAKDTLVSVTFTAHSPGIYQN